MNKEFIIRTVAGHVARLLIPALMYLAGKLGLGLLNDEAGEIAGAVAALAGVVVSVGWSVAGRKKLLATKPPR